jgi:hypothetical protein
MALTLFDGLFSESYILNIIRHNANGVITINSDTLNIITKHVKEYELNLHINDDIDELEINELNDLHSFSIKSLSTLIKNCMIIIEKYIKIQSDKNESYFYFDFYNEVLFKDSIEYTDKTNVISQKKPIINSIYICAVYSIKVILDFWFRKIDNFKRIINYVENTIKTKRNENPNDFEIILYEMRLAQLKKEFEKTEEEIIQSNNENYNIIYTLIYTISNILSRNNEFDIEYLSKIPDQVWGIFQSLIKIPKPEKVEEILNSIIHNIFINQNVSKMLRFDMLSLIISDKLRFRELYMHLSTTQNYTLMLNDLYKLVKLKAYSFNSYTHIFINICNVLQFIMKKHRKSLQKFNSSCEKDFSEIINYSGVRLKKIMYGILQYLSYSITETEQLNNDNESIYNTLTSLLNIFKWLIHFRPDILKSNLSHYIPYVITNIVEQKKKTIIQTPIYPLLCKIVKKCFQSNDFIDYFSLLITDISQFTDFIDNIELIRSRQQMYNHLTDLTDKFIDPIQSTYIKFVGYLPLSNGEKLLCDRNVAKTSLLLHGKNPFNNEAMTVADFNAYQDTIKEDINDAIEEKKQFEDENMRTL